MLKDKLDYYLKDAMNYQEIVHKCERCNFFHTLCGGKTVCNYNRILDLEVNKEACCNKFTTKV